MHPVLRLRPPALEDETQVRAAQRTLAASDDFPFAFDLGDDWGGWVARVAEIAEGRNLPPDRVPASYLLADVDGVVVGRSSIRYALTDWLRAWGGHIGYAVLPGHRRRGYATEILRQSLALARARGIGDVLITCDDDNVASAAIIEAAGGVRDPQWPASEREGPSVPVRRYWIRG